VRGAKTMRSLKIKRIYAPPEPNDGFRVLVDRLWPRGVSKHKAQIDLWLKEIAPSDELRRRFHGSSAKWREFVAAYARELEDGPARGARQTLRERAARETVTLLYAARDETHNNAAALKALIEHTDENARQSS
jgi:uncharacterized protein YeaO (DUF488 family)